MNGSQRRVVITGMGIVSCIGNDLQTVTTALRDSAPGIRFDASYAEKGMRSQVSGGPQIDLEPPIDRNDVPTGLGIRQGRFKGCFIALEFGHQEFRQGGPPVLWS